MDNCIRNVATKEKSITWVRLHKVTQFLDPRAHTRLAEDSQCIMGCLAQIAHGIQHALWQRLSRTLKHDGKRHTKHVLVAEVWGLVALHEPRYAP